MRELLGPVILAARAVEPRTFRPGIVGRLEHGLFLLDVLLNNAQRCPATTGGEVGRRPQDMVPVAFLYIRACDTK